MSDAAQLQKAINGLKAMNAQLECAIADFKAPDAPFPTKNGKSAKVVMLAKWADMIVGNSRIIAVYEAELGTTRS